MFKLSQMPIDPGSTIRMPAGKQRSAIEKFLASGDAPVTPKYAATVLLLRESRKTPNGIAVFMMQRAATMAFVPNAVVFPGGSVREDDAADVAWAGPAPEWWAQAMGVDVPTARSIVVCAARELFEECGVLLAGPDETIAVDLEADEAFWLDARRKLEAHEVSFADLLNGRNLVLRTDYLHVRSHWVTPEFHPKRYDTFFYAAHLPEGQKPHLLTTEATLSDWVDPQWVIDEGDAGRLSVVPPTVFNLKRLAHETDMAAALETRAPVGRTMFRPTGEGDSLTLECVVP